MLKLVIPPPEEYQQNFNELEKRNKSLTDEVQQLRLINQVKRIYFFDSFQLVDLILNQLF